MQLSPSPGGQPLEDADLKVQSFNDVQEDWENVSDAEENSLREATASSVSGSLTASAISIRKRRRVATKTSFVASSTPSKSYPTKGRKKTPLVRKEEVQEALVDGARFTASYTFDVFKDSIKKMRRPLSWLLCLYMLTWLISWMMPTIRIVFSPLCIFPGVSKSVLCVPVKPYSVSFEKLVNIQNSAFDQLIEESMGGSQLSIDVLRAEMATQDLSLLVRYSDLKSKDNVADMLRTIGSDAKKTGRGLSKLDAKVVGAIDEVMALNNYAYGDHQGCSQEGPLTAPSGHFPG
ncbi:hypothetical protein JVU11DRAFT_4502 [Chiua virens]|nr:hypothetical protein JVU11DRAFT_4502 [Chiua virens]